MRSDRHARGCVDVLSSVSRARMADGLFQRLHVLAWRHGVLSSPDRHAKGRRGGSLDHLWFHPDGTARGWWVASLLRFRARAKVYYVF